MATGDRNPHPHQVQPHRFDNHSPSTTTVLAVMALLPVGGTLLGLAGITLAGTMIGIAVAVPLFVIFSPVIVPAVLTIALAVAGFSTSGAFGLTGLSSLCFLVIIILKQGIGTVPEQVGSVKKRLQDLVEYTGQKTTGVGHEIGPEGQVQVDGGART